MADPDAPAHKRLRLDSVNPPVHNGHTFLPPSLPPHTRPLSHPTPSQVSSPPPRHYPSHSLPPPSQPYPSPSQGPYSGHQPSPSLPPSDIRAFADPRNIPSPGQRPHGVPGPSPVTAGVPPDSISTYRAPPTPQPSTAPEPPEQKPPPGMEHGNHPNPWSVNPDHRSNGSVSSGYNAAITPPHPNDGVFHPPPPPPGQAYGQPVPYAMSPYVGQYSSPGQPQTRRKQVRATQACNHCRARKQKCDEARPCQFCKENNFDCQYKDVPPPKQDRSMMQLQDSMNTMSDVLNAFIGEFSAWRQNVESRLPPRSANMASAEGAPTRDPGSSRMPTPIQGRSQPLRVNSMKMESPMAPYMSPGHGQASTPIKQEAPHLGTQQPATPADSVRTETSITTSAISPDKAGLQSDHSTPAHKLLEEWPQMAEFFQGIEYLQKLIDTGRTVSEYPMQLEQDRGLLRPWGVGEGLDLNDGAQGPGSPESNNNESDASSPAPGKEGLWGHPPLDKASPASLNGSTSREHWEHPGGLGPDGKPDFRVAVVDQLLASYDENMRTLHPFLNPSKLQKMCREFKEQYSPDFKGPNVASPAEYALNPGLKRKRSGSTYGDTKTPRGAIEHSLRNAIVLLVLALGKVCSYKEKVPLPSPQSDKGIPPSGAWGSHPNGSFNSEISDDTRPRNIDIMPGMAYYSYATDILGNHHGGLTVAHAQAFILAALYINQFARVLESWSWVNSACRVTIVLLKANLDKLNRDYYLEGRASKELSPKERYKLDLVMFAYWTCVQLESDIVAEMSTLPTSSITQYQSSIMYPENVCESFPLDGMGLVVPLPRKEADQDKEMMIYSSQIYLRVILNEAHNTLYGSGRSKSFDRNDAKAVADNAKDHLNVLKSWRKMLPPYLSWEDDEAPSTHLNIARMRAKYYGALYMMLRPCLRLATQHAWPPSHQGSHQPPHWSHHGSPAQNGEVMTNRGVQMVELNSDQQEMVMLACMCIHAAIRSTIAFDRVGAEEGSPYVGYKSTRTQRLVLTNIFGTMHAQFGNMLVLAAVYKSRMYQHLPADIPLTPGNLDALFERTISALEENAPNSPILVLDLEILRNTRRKLNLSTN